MAMSASSRAGRRVLVVSKPLSPPFNDGSKNVARDVLLGLRALGPEAGRPEVEVSYFVDPRQPDASLGGRPVPLQVATGLRMRALMFQHLLADREHALWHFYFAPNAMSSWAAELARFVHAQMQGRRAPMPTIQTVCSAPEDAHAALPYLFADRVVCTSERTRDAFLEVGVPRERVLTIEPTVALPKGPAMDQGAARRLFALPTDRRLLLYPGDLEFSRGAEVMVRALAQLPADIALLMACRPKTPAAAEKERALRVLAREQGLSHRIYWLGEVASMWPVFAASDLLVLPAETLYAKVDLPIVCLEAMSVGLPVVVAKDTSAAEIGKGGAAVAVAPNPVSVSDTVASLLQSPTELTALARAGRRAATERFAPVRAARAYAELYDELLGV